MNSAIPASVIQTAFLSQIRNKLSDNISLADELAELLNISRDSAYRRIRGETVLSLDDVKKLYDKYRISIDAIVSPQSNMVLINHHPVDFEYSLRDWIKSLIRSLELAKASADLKLIFSAKDIPVFHYFRIPELAAFKLFVWSKSIIKDTSHEHSLYTNDVLPKEIISDAHRAWGLHSSIATTEIWSDEAINGTLKQIEFFHECGYFHQPGTAIELCDHLLTFINLIREEAAEGEKTEGGQFTLYHNEILIPDNTIFASMNNQQMVYLNYNTMDLLTTHQTSFCEKTEMYMNNLIKNSALISATAEKERNRFFNKIEEKINTAKNRLS
jgi:transcriptional regulator with XRE-family HTH domain